MNMPKETLRELLDYHYDRRERVFQFLTGLLPDEFTRDMSAGWSSIRETLLHNLEVEVFWVGHVAQKQERPDWDFDRYPDLGSVRELAGSVRRQTEAFFGPLTDADLAQTLSVTYSSGTTLHFTLTKLFVHVITHDTHHRGQVLTLARQLGHEPQEIDLM